MSSDTALADIMTMLNVTTPAAAVDSVRALIASTNQAPAIEINADGTMRIASGGTVGQVLRLLAAAQARIENVVISS